MKVTHQSPALSQGIEQTKADRLQGKSQIQKGNVEEAGASGEASRGSANIEISDNARFMQQATDVARSAPEVRADRVASLKKSIAEGSYHINSGAIADKILEEHLAGHFGKNTF